MRLYCGLRKERFMLGLCAFFMIPHIAFAQTNEVLGEVELVGATKVEKTSGVWVDGQYLGYLEELKGTKKILLLPGKHEIIVRQGGYKDMPIEVAVQPGQKQIFRVVMEKDTRLSVSPAPAGINWWVSRERVAFLWEDFSSGP